MPNGSGHVARTESLFRARHLTRITTAARTKKAGAEDAHAFVDGGRRIACDAMILLRRTGVGFAPDRAQATAIVLGLAAGGIDESGPHALNPATTAALPRGAGPHGPGDSARTAYLVGDSLR